MEQTSLIFTWISFAGGIRELYNREKEIEEIQNRIKEYKNYEQNLKEQLGIK